MKHIELKDYIDNPIATNLQRIYGDDLQKSAINELGEKDFDNALNQINKSYNLNILTEEESQKAAATLDSILEKARNVKYFKREGTPGNYKYYYTEQEYKEAKGGDEQKPSKEDSRDSITKEDIEQYKSAMSLRKQALQLQAERQELMNKRAKEKGEETRYKGSPQELEKEQALWQESLVMEGKSNMILKKLKKKLNVKTSHYPLLLAQMFRDKL